jgi:predicted transcriptional regulator
MTETTAQEKTTLSTKERAIALIREMPEPVTLEDISEEIRLLAALQKSIAQADAGQLVPHEEVKRRYESWTTK